VKDTRRDFDGLWSLYLWLGVGIAVLIFAVVVFALVRYRAREGREPTDNDEHNALEIGAAVLITAIVALLVFRTFTTEAREDDTSAEPIRIDVTAFQWGWRFQYPGQGVTVIGNSAERPTFAVPGDRPISFALSSLDVVHSFWIPGERFKRAAIPGRVTRFDLEFGTSGVEEGLCTEYCGLRHSDMRFDVWVLSDESYARWLAAHR
jgi:cytochrome c oxidase subunit 2